MTRALMTGLCLLCGGLVGYAGTLGNPFTAIAQRNVFALTPAPPPVAAPKPKVGLPKVFLTGITTILGCKQALFKIQYPATPGKPPKQTDCILTEGQSNGPLEVLRIHDKAGTVDIKNSGSLATVTFEKPPTQKAALPVRPGMRTPPRFPNFRFARRYPFVRR